MVLTRSGASSNKLADRATAMDALPEPVKMPKMLKKKQRTSSKENTVEKVKDNKNIKQKILNEFKKKPKNKQQLTELRQLKQVAQQMQFNVKGDEARKEIVESCEQLAEELGSMHHKFLQPQSSNTMDVTISQYDLTVIPELVDLEDKDEYRKDKKIPSWAKNDHQLHLSLFMQQPHLMDLMSTKRFPTKNNATLRLF